MMVMRFITPVQDRMNEVFSGVGHPAAAGQDGRLAKQAQQQKKQPEAATHGAECTSV